MGAGERDRRPSVDRRPSYTLDRRPSTDRRTSTSASTTGGGERERERRSSTATSASVAVSVSGVSAGVGMGTGERRPSNATSISISERRPSNATSVGAGNGTSERRPSTSGGSPPSSYHHYPPARSSRPGTAGSARDQPLGKPRGGGSSATASTATPATGGSGQLGGELRPAMADHRLRADSSSSDMSRGSNEVVLTASPRSGSGSLPLPLPRSPTTPTPNNMHGGGHSVTAGDSTTSTTSTTTSSANATTIAIPTSTVVGGPVNSTAPFRPRQNSTVSAPSPLASEWSAAALGLEDTDVDDGDKRTDEGGIVGELEMDYPPIAPPTAVAPQSVGVGPVPPHRKSSSASAIPTRPALTPPTYSSSPKSSSSMTSSTTTPKSSSSTPSSTPTIKDVISDVKRRPSILKNTSSSSSSTMTNTTTTMNSVGMRRHHMRSGSGHTLPVTSAMGSAFGMGGVIAGAVQTGSGSGAVTRALRFQSSAGELGMKSSPGPKMTVPQPHSSPQAMSSSPTPSTTLTSPTTSPILAPPGTRLLRSSSSTGSLGRDGSKRVGGYYLPRDVTLPPKRAEIEEEDEDAEGDVDESEIGQLHISPFRETFETQVRSELATRAVPVPVAGGTTMSRPVVSSPSSYPAARGEEFSDDDADGDDDERADEVGVPFWNGSSSANATPTTATTSPNSTKHPYASLTYPGGLSGSYPGGTIGSHYYPHFVAPRRPRGPSFASTTSSYSSDAGAGWDYPPSPGPPSQSQQVQASPRAFGVYPGHHSSPSFAAMSSSPLPTKGGRMIMSSPQLSPSFSQASPSARHRTTSTPQVQSPSVVVLPSPELESERVLLLSTDPVSDASRDKVLLLSPPPLGKRRGSWASSSSGGDSSPSRGTGMGTSTGSTPGASSTTLSAPSGPGTSSSTLNAPIMNPDDGTLSPPDGRLRGDSISSISTDGTSSLMPGSSTDNGTEGSPSSFGVSDEAFAAGAGSSSPRPFVPYRAKFSPKAHSPKLPGASFPPTVYEGDSTSDHTTAHGEELGSEDELGSEEEDDEGGAALPLDIRNISSHAEAQSLVQQAQKEILEGDGEERGNLSLAEQLAAYGETLAIERRFARGEAQRRHWDSRGTRGSESDEEEQELRERKGERPMSPVDMTALAEPLSPRSTAFAAKTPMRDILGNPIPSPREALRNATTKKEVRPTTPKKDAQKSALPPPASNIAAPRVNRILPPFEKHPVTKTTSGRSHRRRATDPELAGAPTPNLRLNPNQPPLSAGIEIIKTLPTPTDSPRSALGGSPRGGPYRPAAGHDDDLSEEEDDTVSGRPDFPQEPPERRLPRNQMTLPPGLPRHSPSPAMEPLERTTTAPAQYSRIPISGSSKFAKAFGDIGGAVTSSAADAFWSKDKGADTASTTGKKKFGLKSLVQSLKGK